MNDKSLSESADRGISRSGNVWLVQLMSEGVGTSGVYPADVLERDGATAFPAGTHTFLNHLTESDEWERSGNHAIQDLVGVTTEDAHYDAETKSLRAPVKWFGGFESFIEEAKDYIGLSVEAHGTINEGIVESITYSPLNAVAVVPRAGRDGKVLSLIESYRENHGTIINESNTDRKDEPVKPEDIDKIVEGVTAALTTALDGLKEALTPAVEVTAPENEAKVDGAEVVEAAVEAGLPKISRSRVVKAVADGAKIEEAIAAEKAFIDEVLKESAVDVPGTIREGKTEDYDFTVGRW